LKGKFQNLTKYFILCRYSTNNPSESEKTMNDTQSIVTIQEELENGKQNMLLLKEYEKDKINFPEDKVYLITIAYITLIIISLLKGSDHFESLIKIKL
jgi:hypothetical protein